MKRTWWRFCLSVLAGACLTAGAGVMLMRSSADAQPPAQKPATPPVPANNAQVAVPGVNLRDFTKSGIEVPTEKLLARQTVPAAGAPPRAEFVNPKVEPGKVRWHADFATACAAAQKSGKPVLLFQMMGKLDDQFC